MFRGEEEQPLQWYAAKVYYNRVQALIEECREGGIEFFAPTDIISSLLFLRTTLGEVRQFEAEHMHRLWLYRQTDRHTIAPIPDREMEVFRFVVSAGHSGLTLLGQDRPEYHEGARVVVTGGPFKGAEGHIKRIKRDRRLVVSIEGVVAVATTYIHPSLLKPIEG